jgi:Uma2 family endonuclease
MSGAVASPPRVAQDDCVVLDWVSWETYEALLADDEDRRVPRIAYDRGVMELVTPSLPHELDSATLTRLVDLIALTLHIPIVSAAATTYRRRDLERGFEPDASFFVQNEARIRGKREIDLSVDPPPDVVLEMEMSRSALDKLRLFASMGIPEVWRCDGERVRILLLAGEGYRESSQSAAIPALAAEVLTRFLILSRTMPSTEWGHAVIDWARGQHGLSAGETG